MYSEFGSILSLFALIALCVPLGLVYLFLEVHSLRTRLARLEAANSSPTPAVAEPPLPLPTAAVEIPASPPSPQAAIPEATEPRTAPLPPAIDWEVFAGGKMLNTIGAIVLVIGIGLLLKYAFDQNWINATMRVLAGLLVGGALVAFGERGRSRSQRPWFSQGLVGAGLGVLYLSGYASFGGYHLIPFALAYGFMSAVTVLAFVLALRSDSLAIALIGWAGGFVTPLAFGDGGSNSEIGLASYLVLLDIGIAATALVKSRWFALTPLALLASYFTAQSWFNQYGDPEQWFATTIALASLWLVFFAAGVAQALREPRESFEWKHLVGALNVVLCWCFAAHVLEDRRAALEAFTLFLATAHLAAWAALQARVPFALWLRLQYALSAGLLLALAIGLRDSGYTLASDYAIVALAVIVVGWFVRGRVPRSAAAFEDPGAAALFLMLASLVVANQVAFWGFSANGPWNLWWGSPDLALIAIAAAGLAFDRLFAAAAEVPAWSRVAARQVSVAAALCLPAMHLSGFALVAALGLDALALAVAGAQARLRDLELDGVLALGLDVLHFAALPGTWSADRIFLFNPIFNERFATFVVVAGAAIAAGECYRRSSLLPALAGRGLRALGVLVGIAGLTVEVSDTFARQIALTRNEPQSGAVLAHLTQLINAEQLAISGLWIAASMVLIGLGIGLRSRDLRVMAIGLFDLTILKAFFVDLGSLDALYRILSFIGLGVTLLLVSAVYQRMERGLFGDLVEQASPGGSTILP